MKLIYYGKDSTGETTLEKKIISIAGENNIEFFSDIEKLSYRFRKMISDEIDLIVMSIENRQELSMILSIKDFLKGHRIILILPDDDPEAIKKSHGLYPRYVGSISENYEDVIAVLKKMMKKTNT